MTIEEAAAWVRETQHKMIKAQKKHGPFSKKYFNATKRYLKAKEKLDWLREIA